MRVLLCDIHRLLIEALATSLTAHGHEVVALTAVPDEAYRAVLELKPDVCVLSAAFPYTNALEVAGRINADTGCKVMMMATHPDAGLIRRSLAAGVAGFVTMNQAFTDVEDTLARLLRGETVVGPEMAHPLLRDTSSPYESSTAPLRFLTPREREALRRIADGQSTKEIAQSMQVAYSTARTHVQNVLTKLGVRSRLQAAALVTRAGLAEELSRPMDVSDAYDEYGTTSDICGSSALATWKGVQVRRREPSRA